MTTAIDPKWIAEIEQEWTALQADENVLHNQDMQKRIVETWKQTSPIFWRRLQVAGIGAKLAFVLQERMWTEAADLISIGMAATDAREQAERNQLMLEPETDQNPEQDYQMWTPELA